MTAYTDTHCHLDFERFNEDRDEVIARAWEAGLEKILNPGIDLETGLEAIRLSEAYPGRIYAAVGVHPNYGQDWMDETLPALREQARNTSVVAIGELDWTIIGNIRRTPSNAKSFASSLTWLPKLISRLLSITGTHRKT